jgi:putative phosphoribosyl transferase
MTAQLLPDRRAAGALLAEALEEYADRDDVLVLALPRGGVPVACEVARALQAPLDLMLVRKLGTPGQPELAMGAIASGGARVLNEDIIAALGIEPRQIDAVAAREEAELERRQHAYRGDRALPSFRDQVVILVDDGIATGATMRAAVTALRRQQPKRIVVAAPVAATRTADLLSREADEVICLEMPEPFGAVGRWYAEFPQVSDDEVRACLADGRL